MKPTLYIHIGFPKTGTTTIQDYLYANRDILKAKGVCYPVVPAGQNLAGHTGHLCMSEECAKFHFDTVPWYEYREKIKDIMLDTGCDVNILSGETFVLDKAENLVCFKDFFNVKIICFIRNYFDWRISVQKQMIRSRYNHNVFNALKRKPFPAGILGTIEKYVNFFGTENCFFLNYDKISRGGDILKEFFSVIGLEFYQKKLMQKFSNVTPSDVSLKFFYDLQFYPLATPEWDLLHNEIFAMELSSWADFRCSFLPKHFFMLDESCKKAVLKQAKLLNDPSWYEHTLARGEYWLSVGNSDLSAEIQNDIFNKLSDDARNILRRYCHDTKENAFSLPNLDNISKDVLNLIVDLRTSYVISYATAERLQNILDIKFTEKKIKDKADQQQRVLVASFLKKFSFFHLSINFVSLFFSAFARQAYIIARSGLFDTGWYLQNNPDVASSMIDPIMHYLRFGVHEFRDPTPWFSTRSYLKNNPDVASSSLNPFYHYVKFGLLEGRPPM